METVNSAMEIVITKGNVGAAAVAILFAVVAGFITYAVLGLFTFANMDNDRGNCTGNLMFPMTALAVIGGAVLGWWLMS